MKRSITTTLVLSTFFLSTTAFAANKVHWGYSGEIGPQHWGSLDPAFHQCSAGKNQSPIDLTGIIEGELTPITAEYQPGGNEISNNGHTIQVNYEPGSTITVDGHQFELKQFHFHTPSENTVEGESFPMEAHFVHADSKGNLAVIALMFKAGNKNPELEKAWVHMPEKQGEKSSLPTSVDARAILPQNLDYYRFNGSLTTPPCSEGVWWLVIKETSPASQEQIEQFSHTMHHPNNRPTQPLNARIIIK